MKSRILGALIMSAAIVALGSVNAMAAEWSGMYYGFNVALPAVKDHATLSPNTVGWGAAGAADIAARTEGDLTANSRAGGIQFGMNWYTPGSSWAWGVEADADLARGSDQRNVTGTFVVVNPADVYHTKTHNRYLATLRPRIGYVTGNWWLYATGGVAAGSLKITDSFASLGGASVAAAHDSPLKVGWTVGVGAELALSSTCSLKAEYLYIDLGSASNRIPSCALCVAGSDIAVHHDLSEDVARLGVNFKF